MSDKLELEYRREGLTYSGRIRLGVDEWALTAVPFSELYMKMHEILCSCALDVAVQIRRTDREGLRPVILDEAARQQLRDSPGMYISSVMPPPRVAGVVAPRTSKLASKYDIPVHSALRAGHSTLADAFGDFVYLPLRQSSFGRLLVESPLDGRWSDLAVLGNLGLAFGVKRSADGKCWGVVRMKQLLALECDRMFLSVNWNRSKWISREDLERRYEQYKKEKQWIPIMRMQPADVAQSAPEQQQGERSVKNQKSC